MHKLSIHNLSIRPILEDINIELFSGAIHAILGPNGTGKSTLFKIIIGILNPNFGRIILDGQLINPIKIEARVDLGIVYLPQGRSIFTGLSVRQNLLAAKDKANCSFERLQAIITDFELKDLLDNRGDQLSGGQQRRVEIARCMALSPKFLLLDEPFAGIDPKTIQQLQSILQKACKEGTGIVITDHQAEKTINMADKITILANGCILTSGTSKEIINNQKVQELYLGTNISFHRNLRE